MTVIVPLAGPDFVLSNGGVKAAVDVDGEPLLRRVLMSRPWVVTAKAYIFVLHEDLPSRRFADDHLSVWFPGCATVFVSRATAGAALSVAIGVAMADVADEPLIVDLADIIIDLDEDPVRRFEDPRVHGVAVTFESSRPEYSYIRLDPSGRFVEAAEKRVISNHASAGVYLFRNAATYYRALSIALANPHVHTYNNLFYVCPLFNGVAHAGGTVEICAGRKILDIKTDLEAR